MTKSLTSLSILAAAVFAVAGANAQSSAAAGTWSVPQMAGEASTMVQGRPNMIVQSPTTGYDSTAPAAQHEMGSASVTTAVPGRAGEASTMVQGRPNMIVHPQAMGHDRMSLDTHSMGNAAATTAVPGRAGEATTMAHGRPNAMLDQHNVARSRADVVNELMQRRSMYEAARRNAQAMGYTGAVGPQ